LKQLVEEVPPALARADAFPAALDQALVFRLCKFRFDRRERQTGALREQRYGKTLHQPQRVKHELEGNLFRRHLAVLDQRVP